MSNRELTAIDVSVAFRLAEIYHAGQTDKSGKRYIDHVLRVAELGDNNSETIVGALHDTVEDTLLTVKVIREIFGDEVADAIDAISRRSSETYNVYLARLKENPLAVIVKLRDLADNSDPARLNSVLDGSRDRLSKRYAHAISFLTSAGINSGA